MEFKYFFFSLHISRYVPTSYIYVTSTMYNSNLDSNIIHMVNDFTCLYLNEVNC